MSDDKQEKISQGQVETWMTLEEINTVKTCIELAMAKVMKWIEYPQWYTDVEGCKRKLREMEKMHDKMQAVYDKNKF